MSPERAAVVRETLMDVAGKLHATVIFGEKLLEQKPHDTWMRGYVEKNRQRADDHLTVANFLEREFAL